MYERPPRPIQRENIDLAEIQLPRSILPVVADLTDHSLGARLANDKATPLALSSADVALIGLGVPATQYDILKIRYLQKESENNPEGWKKFKAWYR